MITNNIGTIENNAANVPFFNAKFEDEKTTLRRSLYKIMPSNALETFGITTIGSAFEMKPLIKNSRLNFKRAELEMQHGNEAFALAETSNNQQLLTIAKWHYEQCREKAGLAETGFTAAANAQTRNKYKEYCRRKVKLAHELHAVSDAMLRKISAQFAN